MPGMFVLQKASIEDPKFRASKEYVKIARAASFFTVPPMPSHGDLPWLVANKTQVASMPKSSLCLHKFNIFNFSYDRHFFLGSGLIYVASQNEIHCHVLDRQK